MNVLVLCDDYWHPARTPRAGLAPLAQEGFALDFIENAKEWSSALMASYPVVLFAKSNNVTAADQTAWMTDEAQQAFVDYVAGGGGLLAVHSGTASYQEALALRRLLGGVFNRHPKQCPVTVEPLAGHPLTAGVTAFTVQDEHYFMDMDDPGVDLFLTASSEHGVQPAGWTRTEGKGRVAVLTPGHNVEVWLESAYQTQLRNALLWCAASDSTD